MYLFHSNGKGYGQIYGRSRHLIKTRVLSLMHVVVIRLFMFPMAAIRIDEGRCH